MSAAAGGPTPRPALIGGLVAAALCTLVAMFQVAVALGAALGRFTQGGQVDGTLPIAGRLVAAGSAVVCVALAAGILARVGYGPLVRGGRLVTVLTWVLVGYSAVAVVLNLASRSVAERAAWVPVSLLLLGSSLAAAVGTRRRRRRAASDAH